MAIQIYCGIFLDVCSAVIGVKDIFRIGLILKPGHSRSGMDQGWFTVGLDNHVWSKSEDPTPASIVVEAIGNQPEILKHFVVDAGANSTASRTVSFLIIRIEEANRAN